MAGTGAARRRLRALDAAVLLLSTIGVAHGQAYMDYDHMKLTKESASVKSGDGTSIVLDMGDVDLNELKRRTLMGTSSLNTFASATDKLVADLMANPMVGIGEGAAVQARNYLPDRTRPQVTGFDLDVSGHPAEITFYFDETVRGDYLNASAISFQASSNITTAQSSYRLTGGSLVNVHGGSLVVRLDEADLNVLKKQ